MKARRILTIAIGVIVAIGMLLGVSAIAFAADGVSAEIGASGLLAMYRAKAAAVSTGSTIIWIAISDIAIAALIIAFAKHRLEN